MNSYEVIFILDPALTEDGVDAELSTVREVVAKKGGRCWRSRSGGKNVSPTK